MDFETVTMDSKRVAELWEKERGNPKLYQRKSTLMQKAPTLMAKGGQVYSEDQTEVVTSFMRAMEEDLSANLDLLPGYKLEGVDVRSSDKYRLLFPQKATRATDS